MELLIMIDMQKDFTTGVLGNDMTKEVVTAVCEEIKEYKKTGIPMIYTMDTHTEDYLNTQEGKNLPVVHCIKGTDGWEIPEKVKEVMKGMTAYKVEKNTFGAKDLPAKVQEVMNEYDISAIKLIGVCTDICVISNAMLLKAYFPEIPIKVKARCCAGVTPQSNMTAINAMKSCQIDVI